MTPAYTDPLVELYEGDCIEVMREMPDASVDSVVTDPPYGLEFMGRDWDRIGAPSRNPSMQANKAIVAGEPEKGNPWASERSSYGTPKRNPRCRKCGLQKFNHPKSKCQCETPDWDLEGWHYNYRMQAWHEQWATEAFRVLKPGGYLLAFGGTRTYHRLASAIEDAGFEIRDTLMWVYASGFPKSLDVSKALDKRPGVSRHAEFAAELRAAIKANGYTNTFDVAEKVVGRRTGAVANWQKYQWPEAKWWPALRDLLGMDAKWDEVIAEAEREKIGQSPHFVAGRRAWSGEYVGGRPIDGTVDERDITAPATDLARKWEGWGTALKPAHEPIVMARKPLQGTVAANVTRYGTGALNIDGTRIGYGEEKPSGWFDEEERKNVGFKLTPGSSSKITSRPGSGRWPSNVLLSDPELFDEPNPGIVGSGSTAGSSGEYVRSLNGSKEGAASIPIDGGHTQYADRGGYSRFFAIPSRFWDKVQRGPECWIWTGSFDAGGYGRFYLSSTERSFKAHRYAWIEANGPIPEGVFVLHRCDNPPCVRPDHLFLGTQQDNMDDLKAKGRGRTRDMLGEARYNAKLTDEKVRELRRLRAEGWSHKQLAERYGIAPQSVSGVVTGRKWAHVTDDDPGLTDYPSAFLIPKAPRHERTVNGKRGTHPTQKPVDLMRHLLKLVTPPGGVALDPFAGSGTTGVAASLEGIRSILIEREPEYAEEAKGRLMATPMGLGLSAPMVQRGRKLPKNPGKEAVRFAPEGKSGENAWFNHSDDEEPAA